ncbi:hypothetical protein BLA29_013072, partial [Euroglyphus maynei]
METSSIFERPGFGSVTFRGKFTPDLLFSTTTTTTTTSSNYDDDNESDDSGQDHDSNGSGIGCLNEDIVIVDNNSNEMIKIWPERDSITSDSIGSAG